MANLDDKGTVGLTAPMSARELDQLRSSRGSKRGATSILLLFHHRQGVTAAPLSDGQSLVVGRAHPADLVLRDASLSRQHASLELIDGMVWVEDLGSTNGTRVGEELVERRIVPPGDELILGAVSVTRQAQADMGTRAGLESHDRFQQALVAEVARGKRFGRNLALILARGAPGQEGHVSRWLQKVSATLQEYDVAALYSDNTVELLVPEEDVDAAVARAEDLAQKEPSLRFGVGVFPGHAASAEELFEVTREALHRATAEARVQVTSMATSTLVAPDGKSEDLVLRSSAMKRVFESAARIGGSAMPVLIQGETGSGKEVVAQKIHESGKRRDAPMISVNCGAIPEHLVESTLFGHERGAFTGAHQQSKGVFESAHSGTVFLDEIGEMPLQAQAAMLRVLETHRFCRVGSTKEIEVDARVVAATHRDLEAMSEQGRFRQDLFYRLDAMAITIPPLRERTEEIEPLVSYFIRKANEANERQITGVDEELLGILKSYRWPGNVRELRNAIERAVVIARGDIITADDLPERVLNEAKRGKAIPTPSSPVVRSEAAINLKAEVQKLESRLIVEALAAADGNRTLAASNLGLAVRTLYHKMKQYGLRQSE